MKSNAVMKDIIKDALVALKSSWLWFYLFPAILALGTFLCLRYTDVSFNLYGGIIETIGIFAAFMFTLVFIIVEHFVKRKEAKPALNEDEKNYISRYRKFAQKSVAMISFSILLAGWVIFLQIIFSQVVSDCKIVSSITNSVFSFFLAQYFVLILLIVGEMYAMLTEDIES